MQRWGDFAEKTQGSVVDLVQRLEGDIKLPAAMPVVRALYAEYLDADWDEEISPAERMAEIPPHVLMEDRELPLVSSTTRSKSLDELMSGRPSITLKTLATFGVRDGGHYLAAIYPDERAIRIRSANDKTFREGSKTSLYHAPGKGPSDLPTLPILLTEGESDTYAGYAAFGREMVVAGFSGTGQVGDKYITDLMGRQIVLGFDGDTSGRKFSRYWASKLKDAGCVVSILPVSEGRDLASYPVASLVELMGRRRQATINVTNLRAARDGYALANDDGSREDLVSNWWAEVSEILLSEDDHAYVLKVHSSEGPQDGTYTLEPQDLEHAAALARWCRKFNGSWWGDTTAVRKLVAELEEQSAYVPVTRTVGRPSLVKPGGFALPGLSISTDVQLDDSNMLVPTATPWPTARGEASAD
ncbi:MAG: toprim domain-containing protein, partial [bacterium]|nr:toprim domain-containing protein [bacterium]